MLGKAGAGVPLDYDAASSETWRQPAGVPGHSGQGNAMTFRVNFRLGLVAAAVSLGAATAVTPVRAVGSTPRR